MISANELKGLYESRSCWELKILDKAVRLKASQNKTSLTLSTGLSARAQHEQDTLYYRFKGSLENKTIIILQSLGYSVTYGGDHQDSWVTISWEE